MALDTSRRFLYGKEVWMIVYKHKQSGKHFIFVDELKTDFDQAIFVTPSLDGKIRIINQHNKVYC